MEREQRRRANGSASRRNCPKAASCARPTKLPSALEGKPPFGQQGEPCEPRRAGAREQAPQCARPMWIALSRRGRDKTTWPLHGRGLGCAHALSGVDSGHLWTVSVPFRHRAPVGGFSFRVTSHQYRSRISTLTWAEIKNCGLALFLCLRKRVPLQLATSYRSWCRRCRARVGLARRDAMRDADLRCTSTWRRRHGPTAPQVSSPPHAVAVWPAKSRPRTHASHTVHMYTPHSADQVATVNRTERGPASA